jgi:hypothetical protein
MEANGAACTTPAFSLPGVPHPSIRDLMSLRTYSP